MNQFVAIGLGAFAGWALVKYLRGSNLVHNPEWRIRRDELDNDVRNVFVGDKLIGSMTNLRIPGEKKSWQAYDWRDFPIPGKHMTAAAAATAVYESVVLKKVPEKAEPKPVEQKSETLDITVPIWVSGVEVESAFGAVQDRFVVWVDDEPAGFIDRRGKNWDAYFIFRGTVETRDLQIEIGTTRKRAIVAVYCAFKLFENVSQAVVQGMQKSYFPKRYVTPPPEPLEPGQTTEQQRPSQRIEEFYTVFHPFQQTASQIASATKIPVAEVERYAKKLAEKRIIYGAVSKERVGTFRRIEAEDHVIPKHDVVSSQSHRRRIVSAPDIKKLRKSGKLTPEEKKQLPRVRQERVYKFALTGPNGELGFYESH